MRIVCPSCQAAYEVPEKLLSGPPRKVRCARCGDAWTPEAIAASIPIALEPAIAEPETSEPAVPESRHFASADSAPEPPPDPVPVPTPIVVPRMEDKLVPAPAEPPGGRLPIILAAGAWAASVVVLASAGWACLAWRSDIMTVWAPSRRLFALLGLT